MDHLQIQIGFVLSLINLMAALKNRGIKTKNLEAIIADIFEESELRNPVHRRRMNLSRGKKNAASHTDFLIALEEQFRLVDYENMLDKHSLLTSS